MSERVTDEEVRSWLVWGRNYGEIRQFRKVGDAGRKWHIELTPGAPITASGREPGGLLGDRRIVPEDLVFTNREALAFAMGLAVAGARADTRASFAETEWGWGDSIDAPNESPDADPGPAALSAGPGREEA